MLECHIFDRFRSCTASNYFSGSAVTYSSSSKTKLLGVTKNLIKKNGLVSHEVARAMAEGAKKNYGTDFAISTTGNAGPTKVDNNEDIGIVFIGIATPEKVESFRFNMGNNRTRVIQKTVNQAFEILYDSLVKS